MVRQLSYAAPAALISHCTRQSSESTGKGESYDVNELAACIDWCADHGFFDEYSDFIGIGMGLKLVNPGEEGKALWRRTYIDSKDGSIRNGVYKDEEYKWESFTTEPTSRTVTIKSLYKRAHDAGWTGTVRNSLMSMLEAAKANTVEALAHSVGANLPPSTPGPSNGPPEATPFLSSQVRAEIAQATLDALSAHDMPLRPGYPVIPQLPEGVSADPLFAPINALIPRILAWAESSPKEVNKELIQRFIGIILTIDIGKSVAEAVYNKIKAHGVKLKSFLSIRNGEAKGFQADIDHSMKSQTTVDYIRDDRLKVVGNNPDNVTLFHQEIDLSIRFNEWLDVVEVKGADWPQWTTYNDDIEAELLTRAARSGTEFTPAREFYARTISAFARRNRFDPAIDFLAQCEREWDGTSRLLTWLTIAAGVPCDPYHQAVGMNLIGSMVRRIRHPGCKLDEMVVLCGYQGSGKSTLAKAICPSAEWFTDSVKLGEEAKELVLKLAGKAVCEVSEMGSRGQIEDVKAMLSTQEDRGRPAYARYVVSRPRRNIFIGSSNSKTPLVDQTGNRRFLCVMVDREIDLAWVEQNRRQLIGEAAHLESRGELFRMPRDLWGVAADKQEAARAQSSEEVLLEDWLNEGEGTTFVTTADGTRKDLVNFITAADLEKLSVLGRFKSTKERAQTMINLGFRSERVVFYGKRVRMWIRGTGIIRKNSVQFIVADTDGFPKVTIRTPLVGFSE